MLTVLAIVLALVVVPSPWGVVLVVCAFGVDVLETLALKAWSQRRRAASGVQTLVGRSAIVLTTLAPDGQVRLDGEIWNAHSTQGLIERGTEVRVRSAAELVLEVERL